METSQIVCPSKVTWPSKSHHFEVVTLKWSLSSGAFLPGKLVVIGGLGARTLALVEWKWEPELHTENWREADSVVTLPQTSQKLQGPDP